MGWATVFTRVEQELRFDYSVQRSFRHAALYFHVEYIKRSAFFFSGDVCLVRTFDVYIHLLPRRYHLQSSLLNVAFQKVIYEQHTQGYVRRL